MTQKTTPARVLIVDDDPTARALMTGVCEASHLDYFIAINGEEALEKATSEVDLVLLDMNLPGIGGIEVCRQLRRSGLSVPIIMVTALTDTVDAVVALEVGANDYVRKPFHPRELEARIASQLRFKGAKPLPRAAARLEFPGLVIDTVRRQVWKDDVEVELTIIEFDLLQILAEGAGMAVSRRDLMRHVWHQDVPDSRTIDAHIYRLRRKIEPDGSTPMYIHNIAGVGYRFAVHALHPMALDHPVPHLAAG